MEFGLQLTLLLAGLTLAVLVVSRWRRASPIARLLEKAHSDFAIGQMADARLCYERALLKIRCEDASEDDREWLATALNGLAYVEFEGGDFAAARQSFEASINACGEQHAIVEVSSRAMLIRISAEESGVESPDVEVRLTSLATTLEALSPELSLEAAHFLSQFSEPLLTDELAGLIDSISPMTIAVVDRLPPPLQNSEMSLAVLNISAWSHVMFCRWKQARELTDRAIAITDKRVSELVQTIYSFQLASAVDMELGDFEAAEDKARRAVTGAEVAPATPWVVAQARSQLAYVLAARGDGEAALAQQESALDLTVRFHDAPQSTFRELTQTAACQRLLARYKEAFSKLDECRRLHLDSTMPAWPYVYFLTVRGLCRMDCWNYAEAREDFLEASSLSTDIYGKCHEWYLRSRLLELSIDQETGHLDTHAAHAEVTSMVDSEIGETLRTDALILLAAIECDLNELAAAEANARKAVSIFESRCGGRTPTAALAAQTLGRILTESGRLDEAFGCLEKAIRNRESAAGGERCPSTARLLESLARVSSAQGQNGQAASFQEHAAAIRADLESTVPAS